MMIKSPRRPISSYQCDIPKCGVGKRCARSAVMTSKHTTPSLTEEEWKTVRSFNAVAIVESSCFWRHSLCDTGQVTSPLWAFVSSSTTDNVEDPLYL
uniref:Uncharacterized protein n=2 Tax=Cercopithecinae TaxID=9528 RepID=A0A2K5NUM3_CERAT|nr:hypothetical protein [Macaca fascicularis]